MLGIIYLLTAIVLYGYRKWRHLSYFMYVSLMLGYGGGGMGLWTEHVLGVKNTDLALIYTFCINGFLLTQRKWKLPSKAWWVKFYLLLLLFLMGSVLFSFFYYNFTPYQILQGGRNFLLLFSIPILIRIRKADLQRILELLLWVTVLTSVLYCLQIVTGRPWMPYVGEPMIDRVTGIHRFFNVPALLQFFLIASFVCPRFFPGNTNLYRALFFVTLMCTLGRTYIFSTIFSVLLAVMFMGRASKLLKALVIVGVLFLPFVDMISQRFEGNETAEDVRHSLDGGYADYQSGDGTMSYRWAWVYERGEFLVHRPIGEQIFGLGLITGSQDVVYKMYHFTIGGVNEDGNVEPLFTPDISYGNLLTQLGFVGGTIYIVFVISLAVLFFRRRKEIPLLTICSADLIVLFIGAFSGSAMSEPRNFVMYFLALSLIHPALHQRLLERRPSKWILLPMMGRREKKMPNNNVRKREETINGNEGDSH